VEVVDVPGDHFEMFREPALSILAQSLSRQILRVTRTSGG
jgi:thioesterase domain-containing protein